LLRPGKDGRLGETDRQVRWLADLIRPQVRLASGIDLGTITADSISTDALARFVDEPDPVAGWARRFEGRDLPDELIEFYRARLHDAFCVTFEAPPYLLEVFAHLHVPFLDIRIHPVRFLDDLIFAVRAAGPQMQAYLRQEALPESSMYVQAGIRAATARGISAKIAGEDALLVIGQARHDGTQITNGRFADATLYLDDIEAIGGRHRTILLKPHPYDPHHSLIERVRRAFPHARVARDNVYSLLSAPEVTEVLTFNSSVAYEASFFGKPVRTLLARPFDVAFREHEGRQGCHESIGDHLLDVDFWRYALASYVPVTATDGVRISPKPNRLRISLQTFWNFNEIDTDLVPSKRITLAQRIRSSAAKGAVASLTRARHVPSLRVFAARARRTLMVNAYVLARIATDRSVSFEARIPAILAIVYLLAPFDLIPDTIPAFGLLDDVAALALGLRFTVAIIGDTKVAAYRAAAITLLEQA
jgi:uncharacterized membrane protein YkvA (DUF1232 family)